MVMNIPRWLAAWAVALLLLSALAPTAFGAGVPSPLADSSQATLTVQTPSVTVINGQSGSSHEGASGETLSSGDRIITGTPGAAVITFSDGSEQELDAGTEVRLDQLGQTSGGGTLTLVAQAGGTTVNRVAKLGTNSTLLHHRVSIGGVSLGGGKSSTRLGVWPGPSA